MEPPLLGICLSLVLRYTMAYNITGKKGVTSGWRSPAVKMRLPLVAGIAGCAGAVVGGAVGMHDAPDDGCHQGCAQEDGVDDDMGDPDFFGDHVQADAVLQDDHAGDAGKG